MRFVNKSTGPARGRFTGTTVGLLAVVAAIAVLGWYGPAAIAAVTARGQELTLLGVGNGSGLFVRCVSTPALLLAGILVAVSPGALAPFMIGGVSRWSELPGRALLLSLLLLGPIGTILRAVALPPGARALPLSAIVIAALLAGCIVFRRRAIRWPAVERVDLRRAAWAVALFWGLCIALSSKLFHENLNPDGLEALECGRLLSHSVLPVWGADHELHGFPGITTIAFTYPINWFVELFGPVEIAARLPFLLYLGVLYFAIIALVECGTKRRLGVWGEGLIALALSTYAIVMAYGASYDPYSADIAQPGARETLLMAMFLTALHALWSQRPGWFVLAAALTFMTSPNGGILLLLTGGAVMLVGGDHRRHRLLAVGGSLVACAVLAVLWSWAAGGSEHSADSLTRRLLYWEFTEFKRISFMLIPCGVVPALALFAYRRQDDLARMIALVCAVHFVFFYCQGFVALHHFVPAMVLPLVVFWRIRLTERWGGRWLSPVAGAAGVLCLVASLPPTGRIEQRMRQFGLATELRIPEASMDSAETLRRCNSLFRTAFRVDWDLKDGETEWGGQPYCWVHYALRPKPDRQRIDFIAQPISQAAPSDFVEIGRTDRDVLFARSRDVYQELRYPKAATSSIPGIYALPRTTLFKHLGLEAGTVDVDLRPVVRRLVGNDV